MTNLLATVVNEDVLPALQSMQTEKALIALWQTGRSPMLVDTRRLLYLGLLLHRAGRHDELEAVRAELESKADNVFAVRALAKLKGVEC